MSYDLGFWADPKGIYRANPSARYLALCEMEDDGNVSPELDAFITELETRWPGGSDEDFEGSPWSSWPLRSQATGSGIVVNTRFSADVATIEEMVSMAQKHGLVAYDPQGDDVYGPGGIADNAGRTDRSVPQTPATTRTADRPARRPGALVASGMGARLIRMVLVFVIVAGLLALVGALGH